MDISPEKPVASVALRKTVTVRSVAPPRPAAAPRPAPEDLHPALWRAFQMGRLAQAPQGSVASGYDALDAQLPGGVWPARALTELLLPRTGVGELRLLAPAMAAVQGQGRDLLWLDPPAEPCAWALAELGVNVKQLVLVRSRTGQGAQPAPRGPGRVGGTAGHPAADLLWALEHALKSGHLGAALAWLPSQPGSRLPPDALRRLQLAAQAHDGPVFLFRSDAERTRPSPAPLRLLLACAGPDALQVHLLKRRGPPLQQPLWLDLPPVLSSAALERAQQLQAAAAAGGSSAFETTSLQA